MALNFNTDPAAKSADILPGLYNNQNINSLLKRMQKKGTLGASGTIDKKLLSDFFEQARNNAWSSDKIVVDGLPENSGLGTTAALAGNWMADHKLKTAGLGLLGAGNIAGLFDNPNVIGQLAGLGGGFAAGKMLIPKITKNPLTGSGMAIATMGGGFLGSIFDKLMAAKDTRQYQEQYY